MVPILTGGFVFAADLIRELCKVGCDPEVDFIQLSSYGKARDSSGEVKMLKDVTIPVCAIACETDHIAAWKSSYAGVQKMGSKDKTFILTESGHIAGIINPPSKKKYGHYTNPEMGLTPDDWMDAADKNEGSWWPRWDSWMSQKSGISGVVSARNERDRYNG